MITFFCLLEAFHFSQANISRVELCKGIPNQSERATRHCELNTHLKKMCSKVSVAREHTGQLSSSINKNLKGLSWVLGLFWRESHTINRYWIEGQSQKNLAQETEAFRRMQICRLHQCYFFFFEFSAHYFFMLKTHQLFLYFLYFFNFKLKT